MTKLFLIYSVEKDLLTNTKRYFWNTTKLKSQSKNVLNLFKLSDLEENINATYIALDAQKAFDSVNHRYIVQVLEKIGLSNCRSR